MIGAANGSRVVRAPNRREARAKAAESRELAQQAIYPEHGILLEHIAGTWERIARGHGKRRLRFLIGRCRLSIAFFISPFYPLLRHDKPSRPSGLRGSRLGGAKARFSI
jgi:hypothetical protein